MIRLGTRGSALALAQARWVAERLPGEVELVPITTSGDTQVGAGAPRGTGERQPSRGSDPLEGLTDKSRFVKEIEEALSAGTVDLAVHSAKDVPSELPDGLAIVGVPERADARDALCGADSLDELPEGATVGTASLRRRAALLARRPDLDVRELRGNVDTRLRRLEEGHFDAIVVACAGLERLGRSDAGTPIDPEHVVPAPGQGCLVLEARAGHEDVAEAATSLTDRDALTCLTAERALVQVLDASCHTPIGAHAETTNQGLRLRAFVGLPDGSQWIRDELEGVSLEPAALGAAVGERLLGAGAAELLREAERVAFAS